MASPARLERATPAFGGRRSRPLSYGELSVDGRGRTCTLRFRRPAPSPFGHVDVAPPTGLEPVTFCSTGSCSGRLSYSGGVRALGLEPSLVRGKSPVPYLSGVTRVVGREGIEPPVSEDGWSTASCAPWRDRPMSKPGGAGLDDDVSAVVKVLMAGLVARRPSRLGRCRTPGRRCWRPRRHHWLEPKRKCAHDVVRVMRRSAEDQTGSVGATSARRACQHWQAPVVPADPHDRGIGRVCTRARRSSTGIDPGAFVRRCGCVP